VPLSLRVRSPTRTAPAFALADEADADETDLAAWARGDREAFARLYRRYLGPVYRYCHRRLGTREAAEDATSQIFARALAALPGYRGGPFRSWLFAIAHNVVTDGFRAARPVAPIEAAAEVADAGPSPEEQALEAEEGLWLRGMLAQLPADQRRVVELRLSGLTNPEIAHVLGRNHAAVRSAQSRAVARLRRLMGAPARPEEAPDA
jgi:RNA polymerase sigma-70 factor (ECF subfamily)